MKRFIDSKIITLERIGVRYFSRANDDKFGIYYDEVEEKIKIGDQPITFSDNDVILIRNKIRYTGTEGLWRLLTKSDYFEKEGTYTDDDWDNYKDILIRTILNQAGQKRAKVASGKE